MSDTAAIMEMSGSFVPVVQEITESQAERSMLETIEASLPLTIVAGVSASLLSFVVMFALGMFFESTAFQHALLRMYPAQNVAIVDLGFVILAVAATLRAGLSNNIPQALMAGSLGALVLGVLAGAVLL